MAPKSQVSVNPDDLYLRTLWHLFSLDIYNLMSIMLRIRSHYTAILGLEVLLNKNKATAAHRYYGEFKISANKVVKNTTPKMMLSSACNCISSMWWESIRFQLTMTIESAMAVWATKASRCQKQDDEHQNARRKTADMGVLAPAS